MRFFTLQQAKRDQLFREQSETLPSDKQPGTSRLLPDPLRPSGFSGLEAGTFLPPAGTFRPPELNVHTAVTHAQVRQMARGDEVLGKLLKIFCGDLRGKD